MKLEEQLREWHEAWATHCIASTEDADPGIADNPGISPQRPTNPPLTVSRSADFSERMLNKLQDSIALDLDTERKQRSLHLVGRSVFTDAERANLVQPVNVLLLRPSESGRATRELFVVVIEVYPSGALVVPFGPLGRPAVVSEMLSDFEDEALRVLCLWNAQRLPWQAALRSWHIADASARLLEEISTLRACLAANRPLPGDLSLKIGPSALVAGDERFRYLAKEEEIWDSYLP
jgi:hypothetical protein